MGWLDKWSRSKGQRDHDDTIHVEVEQLREGINLKLYKGETNRPLELPLELSVADLRHQSELDVLELVEALWYDEILQPYSHGYLFPYEQLVQAPTAIRQLLGVPEPSKLTLSLEHDGAVGARHFKLRTVINYGSWRNLERTARRNGPWLILPDKKVVLMKPDQAAFIALTDDQPDALDKEQVIPYVARVRQEATRLEIPMDRYLQSQAYYFADGLDVNVQYDGNNITLAPVFQADEAVDRRLLDELNETGSNYSSDGRGAKLFVQKDVSDQAQQLRAVPPISGADIPRFANNPESFLPELDRLDLSLFGARVKSLGIRVYRAQPYVHATEKDRGWFEVNSGISILDEEGEKQSDLSPSEFQSLADEARASGQSYVEWNNQWVQVPDDATDFLEATGQLQQALADNPEMDITKLPYILEIFDNIGQLEFNQPFLDAQSKLVDSGILERSTPAAFQAQLKPFQIDGYVWMKMLHYRNLGGLLADDMGLGKTIQVITLLTYLHEKNMLHPTLVVVPKTLIQNWVGEISRFAPSMRFGIYVHTGESRVRDPEALKHAGIVLTTYQTLVRDQLAFGQVKWQTIVCDEAQAIKNNSTAVSKAIKAMQARFRLAMTGTPVENSLIDLWSIMDYVQPGLLGSLSEFKKDFVDKLGDEHRDAEIEQKLISRLSMVYKRRTKSEELGDQLPPKTIVEERIGLSHEQRELYMSIVRQVSKKQLSGLQAIQHLRAICSHPALFDEKYNTLDPNQLPKLKKTLEIVERVRKQGGKVLIFTDLHRMQDLIRHAIREKFGINPSIINGMTERRQSVVDSFNNKLGFDVMILSPKAAGTGLTITSANHVIHYTRWWNPAVENQATDRVYRIGQTKPVSVYYPIVTDEERVLKSGTVEEIVHRILSEKQELASSVIISSRNLNLDAEVMARAFE